MADKTLGEAYRFEDERLSDFFAWYARQEDEARARLAARAALRVWPFAITPSIWQSPVDSFARRMLFSTSQSLFFSIIDKVPPSIVKELPTARSDDLTGILGSGVANDVHAATMHAAYRSAYDCIAEKAYNGSGYGEFSIVASLAAAGHGECLHIWWQGVNKDGYLSRDENNSGSPPKPEYLAEVVDCLFLDQELSGRELMEKHIWRGIPPPRALQVRSADSTILGELSEFRFFRDWYQGILDGKPLDWQLQRRVAQIGNFFWDDGPKAVAEEIAKIRVVFDLEKRVEDLEAELRSVATNRYGIGGNMPPEPLNDAPIAQELVIVWGPLADLKDEIAKSNPDPTRLQKIIEMLATALRKGADWCLKKGDLMVDTAIRWAIPAGGTGYFALNPEKLESVIEFAEKLVGLL